MERSDYKPLTDEELDWVNHWQARKIFRERIMEQLRRANALAEAARDFHGDLNESIYTKNCSVCKALAAYLGETR